MSTTLSLEARAEAGKDLKALRAAGMIPSVIYGGESPILASSAYNATEKALREVGYHSPVELDIAGKKQLAVVRDIHIDPVSRRIINVEFQAVSATEAIEAYTPIRVVNFEASEANKKHFVYLQVLEEIEVKARPADLPEVIEVDGSVLNDVDDKITVADLQLPKGVELADKELDPATAVLNVYDPAAEAAAREAKDKAAEEAAAAAAEAPAEEAAAEASAEESAE